MKRFLIFLFLLLSVAATAQDQEYDEPVSGEGFSRDNIFITASPRLNFWSGFVFFELSPGVGYRFSERFSAGAGSAFAYYREKFYNPFSNIYEVNEDLIYGPRAFAQFVVWENIFLHGEIDMVSREVWEWEPLNMEFQKRRRFIPGFYLAGGLRQHMAPWATADLIIGYNFLEINDSFYRNPVFRTAISIYL